MPAFCHTSELNKVTPLDEPCSALGTEPTHNGRLVVLGFAAAFPSLRISNSQIFRQVLPMPLFSSAFMEMARRFSCHHTMPKQAGCAKWALVPCDRDNERAERRVRRRRRKKRRRAVGGGL
ncbi:uncharacterized protein V6R79_013061 [Siganus canaliculatus]